MNRPSITKKLSLISCCLSSVCILIQACVPAFEKILTVFNLNDNLHGELTAPVVILLLISACKMLPFIGVICWNWYQDTMTNSKAMVTVILVSILYISGGPLANGVFRVVIVRLFSLEVFSSYVTFASIQDLFSLLHLAALVLLCCACAIDLYVLKHPVNPQNQ